MGASTSSPLPDGADPADAVLGDESPDSERPERWVRERLRYQCCGLGMPRIPDDHSMSPEFSKAPSCIFRGDKRRRSTTTSSHMTDGPSDSPPSSIMRLEALISQIEVVEDARQKIAEALQLQQQQPDQSSSSSASASASSGAVSASAGDGAGDKCSLLLSGASPEVDKPKNTYDWMMYLVHENVVFSQFGMSGREVLDALAQVGLDDPTRPVELPELQRTFPRFLMAIDHLLAQRLGRLEAERGPLQLSVHKVESIIRRSFHKIDVDNDGQISLDEFMDVVRLGKRLGIWGLAGEEAPTAATFGSLDGDGDGLISEGEFRQLPTKTLRLLQRTIDTEKEMKQRYRYTYW
ncbi:unnamed protein product [Vitrella brassicaformis CCMP3155]|uniref:EF-hand domain-containing protein n=1 Tax=Vitrella brassicaformis (strain CCMP3155) TaxID=1169540 RepID=A0A0G4GVU9_VITBC|nr:unnamed protein product [Vitrella brassicaformis CCMP3155]|eukprot:CEM35007.1 unnamed protein product [Vitrella brassicaformis CCMP3155]